MLLQSTAFDDLIYAEGMVSGVKTLQGNDAHIIHTSLVIGADGRNSQVRTKAGLQSKALAHPVMCCGSGWANRNRSRMGYGS